MRRFNSKQLAEAYAAIAIAVKAESVWEGEAGGQVQALNAAQRQRVAYEMLVVAIDMDPSVLERHKRTAELWRMASARLGKKDKP